MHLAYYTTKYKQSIHYINNYTPHKANEHWACLYICMYAHMYDLWEIIPFTLTSIHSNKLKKLQLKGKQQQNVYVRR